MPSLFLLLIAGAVLAVLLSSVYLYFYFGSGDRERIPERICLYLALTVMTFISLKYGERAGVIAMNLQVIATSFVLGSGYLTGWQALRAYRNQVNFLAKKQAERLRHQRHRPTPG